MLASDKYRERERQTQTDTDRHRQTQTDIAIVVDEEVFRLQVAVHHVLAVTVLHPRHDLLLYIYI